MLSTFYYMAVSIKNSKDIVANRISVSDKDKVVDLKELFLSKVRHY